MGNFGSDRIVFTKAIGRAFVGGEDVVILCEPTVKTFAIDPKSPHAADHQQQHADEACSCCCFADLLADRHGVKLAQEEVKGPEEEEAA